MMKAVVYHKYGPADVLHMDEVAKPTPAADEVLIKIRATTVTAGDWRMRKAKPFEARLYNGLFKPSRITILGFECAGDVAAIGADVREFAVGDAVFAFAGIGFGCYAEYVSLSAKMHQTRGVVTHKPDNLSYTQAAAVPVGGITALQFLRKAGLQHGQRILVYGASGSVGTYTVQIARHFGAEVTGVCSTTNVAMVRSLGAQRVIDYTREDFSAGGDTYDIVFDAVGKASRRACKRVLAPGGRYVSVRGNGAPYDDDLTTLKRLFEEGAVTPVIDRSYPLAEIREAHRYVEREHKKGNVVIEVA